MAGENGTASHDVIAQLQAGITAYDFNQVMRLLEAHYADKPRFATGAKLSDDAVRFGQEADLQFAPSALARFDLHNQVPRLSVHCFGMFGPNGPLPLHLTEYARERLRNHHDDTFARFADIFHHRMIALFYRAWANSRPAVSFDRPDTDRFGFYIGALQGRATPAFRNRDALPDRLKWFYSGHFSTQTKHPDGLRAMIGDLFHTKVGINEFVGEWMAIAASDQSRLGVAPQLASLGESALVGGSVWGCQHKFRIVLGPLNFKQYLSLLPGADALAQLVAIVRNYIGDELVWDAQLLLKQQEVPSELVLGSAGNTVAGQLGWSSWLGPRNTAQDADDLLLNPYIHQF
jgi:type VI secretion system protein ImpH